MHELIKLDITEMGSEMRGMYSKENQKHSEQGMFQTAVFHFPELIEHFTGPTFQSDIDLLLGRYLQ